jgi:predicted amidohydrolase YtcJ
MAQAADILITQAKVITSDPAKPRAEAVGVQGNRIVFVGSAAEATEWRGPQTRTIDSQGLTLMPGFIDSHFHLLYGSLKLKNAQLFEAKDLMELAEILRTFTAQREQNSSSQEPDWVVGSGLRYSVGPPGQTLTRLQLDAIVADRPLYLVAYDGHTAWANTLALQMAEILQGGETGLNSEIVMAPDGTATGELREPGAMDYVRNLLPQPSEAEKRELLRRGLAETAALGITSVHNMDGDAEQMALYASMLEAGELSLRVYLPYSITPETPLDALAGEAVPLWANYQSLMLRGGCVKFFMDGVIESYTGLLVDDYVGQPGLKGEANYTVEHFNQLATEADRLGFQIFVHAVGDGAVRRTLNAYQTIQQVNGRRDSRHRVEHIELIHPDDIHRFAELGVIASMQPLHSPLEANDPDVWPSRVGEERWGCSFAWRTLRQAGAHLAFGSDWPVVAQNPYLGLYAALNRQPWRPGLPDQRQTLEETIAGYTRDAAYAEFQEHEKGQLVAGMLADMVLLSADLETLPPEEIAQVRPLLTMVDGRVVYEG